jgi:hypothetical protein
MALKLTKRVVDAAAPRSTRYTVFDSAPSQASDCVSFLLARSPGFSSIVPEKVVAVLPSGG